MDFVRRLHQLHAQRQQRHEGQSQPSHSRLQSSPYPPIPAKIADPWDASTNANPLLYQSFEWYSHTSSPSPPQTYYDHLRTLIPCFSRLGISLIWLPPGCKAGNPQGNGYDVYDLWDLGEFDWKGQRNTKWGNIEQLRELCRHTKEYGIGLIWDAVLSHRASGDFAEEVVAVEVSDEDRTKPIGAPHTIRAWTGFDFPSRNNQYSGLKLRKQHFNGTDWDDVKREKKIFNFCQEVGDERDLAEKHKKVTLTWAPDVDEEFGNYDYLMFTNLDYQRSLELRQDTLAWGKWITDELGLSGFRLDAMKHLPQSFVLDFMRCLQDDLGRDFLFVGEYWKWGNSEFLQEVGRKLQGRCRFYDVQLCYNFSDFSMGKKKDLRGILEGSLVELDAEHAVTIVSNHDTQPTQLLFAPLKTWFLPHAYCISLLRACASLPCVFHGHLFGIQGPEPAPRLDCLPTLMLIRSRYAYGVQYNYWDDAECIGWTRIGRHKTEGCAVLLNIGHRKMKKNMFVGLNRGQETRLFWVDVLSPEATRATIAIDEKGHGIFEVAARSAAVFLTRESLTEFYEARRNLDRFSC